MQKANVIGLFKNKKKKVIKIIHLSLYKKSNYNKKKNTF